MPTKWQKRADYVASVLEANDGQLWRALRSRENDRLTNIGVTTPAEAVILFASGDPNEHRKPYLGWLVSTYIKGGYLLEDLGKAKETLHLFDQIKHRLPAEDRDINRFHQLGDVWSKVDPFLPKDDETTWSPSKRAEERELRQKVMSESRILVAREDGFTVAIPMTERSAKWWGRGTRWCTAAENDNMFRQYHSKSPLVVMRWPDGRKIQAFITEDDVQIMDEADRPIEIEFIQERWEDMKPIIDAAYKHGDMNDIILQLVPHEHRTPEIILQAVKNNGYALYYLRDEAKTEEIILAALNQAGQALEYVPSRMLTSEMCWVAIKEDSMALRYVPEVLLTPEMCMVAAQKKGTCLSMVPKEMITMEMCRAAVLSEGGALRYVPEKFRTPENIQSAVTQNGRAIQHVPAEQITSDLVMAAVKNHSRAIFYAPEDKITAEIAFAAVRKEGGILKHIPVNLLTKDLVMDAGKQVGHLVFDHIPAELFTPELYFAAVEADAKSIMYVPEKFLTPEICLAAVQKNGLALQEIPEEMRTPEICMAAVQQDGMAMIEVPAELRTPEMVMAAKQNLDAIVKEEDELSPDWDRYAQIWNDAAIQLNTVSNIQHKIQAPEINSVPTPCP